MLDDPLIASDLSRRVNAERIVLLGWTRAILLQLAHPLIAAGVGDHSSFRGSPAATLRRLHGTVSAMLAIAFGDLRERETALDGIRAIHRRVNGTLPTACGPYPAGTRYSAEDPALLLWVHATLAESVVIVYDHLVAPLSETERDLYCAGSADVAVALGADPVCVPRRWSALRTYLDGQYAAGSIVVCARARELAASVLAPFSVRAAAPVTAVTTLLTAGLLPEHIRCEYGLAWNPRRERAFRIAIGTVRAMRRLTPRVVAWWPQARRRTRQGETTQATETQRHRGRNGL